jgi:hypothetical protein
MNQEKTTDLARGAALAEEALSLVVGGDGDPNDPVGTATGQIEVDLKSTPILM